MNLLMRLYPGDEFCVVALNVVVQVTVIALLAVVAGRTVARRNAAVRHCILLSALLWISVSPAAAWGLRHAGLFTVDIKPVGLVAGEAASSAPTPERESAGLQTPVVAPVARHEIAAVEAPTQFMGATRDRVDRRHILVSLALVVWGAVVVVLLMRLARAVRGVWRIRRAAMGAGVGLQAVVAEACRCLGIARPPLLLVSDAVSGPVTIGILRGAIVLPPAFGQDVPVSQLREVVVHEVLHVVRHDFAVGVFQRVVAAVLWFHPAVHLLNRELSRAREEVCDNAVLRVGRATDYARTLLELSQRIGTRITPALVPGLFGRSWRLEDRIAGILNRRRVVMTSVRMTSRVVVASLVLSVGVALSAVSATRAQEAAQGRQDRTKPASTESSGAPAAPATTAASGGQSASWLDHGANFVSPDEEAVRAKEEQGRIAVSKASLSLKEAQIKLRSATLDLDRKNAMLGNHTISAGEVEQAKLAVDLAQVQVQRAEVDLLEAKSAAVPTRMIGLTVRDGTRSESDRYNEHGLNSLRGFLEVHFKNALEPGWTVTVLRRGNGLSRVVAIRGSSGVESQNLQAGDSVVVRRDVVRVMKDTEVVWQTELKGRKMTLPEALAEAGVGYKAGETDYRVEWTGSRPGTPSGDLNWSANLSNIAAGFGKNEVVEPSDVIVLRRR